MMNKPTHALRGYIYALGTSACWAFSPVLIRKGFETIPSPLWATFIGLLAAVTVYWVWFLLRTRGHIERSEDKAAYGFQAAAGITAGLGISSRNIALTLAPVVVVLPLAQTTAFFTLLLAPLVLGKQAERINLRLIVGICALMLGVVLIVLGQ